MRHAALSELERVAADLPRQDLPDFLGELERIRVGLLLAATSGPAPEPVAEPSQNGDRLLSVAEAAAKLGRSKWWVYKNKTALPIVRLPTGGYGFSERKLESWISRRSSRA